MGISRATLLDAAIAIAGRSITDALAEPKTRKAIAAAWKKIRARVPILARIALDGLVSSVVVSEPDAGTTNSERHNDGESVIDLVEGEDFFVRPPNEP